MSIKLNKKPFPNKQKGKRKKRKKIHKRIGEKQQLELVVIQEEEEK